MKPERWAQVEELFHEALGLESDDREAFLADIGGKDPELRDEILSLLDSHEQEGMLHEYEEETDAQSDQAERIAKAVAGRYTVESEAGRGAMATVYRATDSKHHRTVAIKVLHPNVGHALGPDRFLAEIETTAGLHHPHILPLFDSGEADGLLYYVMPFVEGESLRQRLSRERQLPVEEAVRLARQIAAALDYAHRRGVIHRDVKPANVLLQEGQPVVSDFGIALAIGAAREDRLTQGGYSLGTPRYMSPEQVTGDHPAGPASDIYALACVLHEMLVGDPPFVGGSTESVLRKIVRGLAIPPREVRKSIPENVDSAIQKALERIPADRFKTAQAFAEALANPSFRYGKSATPADSPALRMWRTAALVATGLLLVLAAVLLPGQFEEVLPDRVQRFDLTPPAELPMLDTYIGVGVALSPDGGQLVYVGAGPEGQQLVQRRLDALDPTPIAWTSGADNPVFSPDGSMVAFREGTSLKTVSLLGGLPSTVLSEGITGRYIDWGPDNFIYFASDSVVARVPGSGGPVEVVTQQVAGARTRLPRALPDGRGLLVTLRRDAAAQATVGVSGPDGVIRELFPGLSARYATSGHVVYATADGRLMAAPFDLDALEVTGESVQILGDLDVRLPGLGAQFAISQTGTLAYRTVAMSNLYRPAWVDRAGNATAVDPTWSFRGSVDDSGLALSPDGEAVALSIPRGAGGGWDLWVKELDGGSLNRLTSDGIENRRPSWSSDGNLITYVHDSGASQEVRRRRADGAGQSTTVSLGSGDTSAAAPSEAFFSPSEEWLIFRAGSTDDNSNPDIFALRADMDDEAYPLLAEAHIEWSPALSPDGRWLAYGSDESGRSEVYVRPFPDVGSAVVQVSNTGGDNPMWSRDGGELYYRNDADELVAAELAGSTAPTVLSRTTLFAANRFLRGHGHPGYDVSPDDQRFLMLERLDTEAASRMVFVRNWFDELGRLAPR